MNDWISDDDDNGLDVSGEKIDVAQNEFLNDVALEDEQEEYIEEGGGDYLDEKI